MESRWQYATPVHPKVALKVDLRDHISMEVRRYTGKFTVRNNFQFGIGLAFYTGLNK